MADLKGKALPDVALVATLPFPLPQADEESRNVFLATSTINLSRIPGYTVTFIYPWTGREGHENPHDWDNIASAHGSTPQALAYNKLLPQFAELGAGVFGLSSMRTSWQKDFVNKNMLQFSLVSDEQENFASALGLDWLRAGARQFLCRRTLISHDGMVVMDRQAIPYPEDDAGQTLALLRVLMKR